jgi:hypothetical protein
MWQVTRLRTSHSMLYFLSSCELCTIGPNFATSGICLRSCRSRDFASLRMNCTPHNQISRFKPDNFRKTPPFVSLGE